VLLCVQMSMLDGSEEGYARTLSTKPAQFTYAGSPAAEVRAAVMRTIWLVDSNNSGAV
jgi:hypothetical protein